MYPTQTVPYQGKVHKVIIKYPQMLLFSVIFYNLNIKMSDYICSCNCKLFLLGTSDVTSFLMTEARQHNTEIRLAVGKVADKMDLLSSKVSTYTPLHTLHLDVQTQVILVLFFLHFRSMTYKSKVAFHWAYLTYPWKQPWLCTTFRELYR